MSQRIAYFDCFSGASGDMLLGALLDAGLTLEQLESDLQALGLADYHLQVERRADHGITGIKFDVVDASQAHPLRHLGVIREIIGGADLPAEVAQKSLVVFERLAQAEAHIHGTDMEEVHFHEIGAVDTLIDVVGFCLAVYRLGIAEVYSSALPVGQGTIQTEHGLLPVPAPATLELLASAGAPIVPGKAAGEMVTPTGAAILSTLARFERPTMRVQRVGYGFGNKRFAWANVVRVWIGEPYMPTNDAPGSFCHDRHHEHSHSHEGLDHDHQITHHHK